jgi:hypothetical protein
MTRTRKYYRVDSYINNFGTMLYITADRPSYAGICSAQQAEDIYGGDYLQVTEFVAASDLSIKEAWEQGEILSTKYFMPQ